MNNDPRTYLLFLLCLLVQAQEQRIRRLEQFNAQLMAEVKRLTPRQIGHLRRVK
jgi:hypothetical protein